MLMSYVGLLVVHCDVVLPLSLFQQVTKDSGQLNKPRSTKYYMSNKRRIHTFKNTYINFIIEQEFSQLDTRRYKDN